MSRPDIEAIVESLRRFGVMSYSQRLFGSDDDYVQLFTGPEQDRDALEIWIHGTGEIRFFPRNPQWGQPAFDARMAEILSTIAAQLWPDPAVRYRMAMSSAERRDDLFTGVGPKLSAIEVPFRETRVEHGQSASQRTRRLKTGGPS